MGAATEERQNGTCICIMRYNGTRPRSACNALRGAGWGQAEAGQHLWSCVLGCGSVGRGPCGSSSGSWHSEGLCCSAAPAADVRSLLHLHLLHGRPNHVLQLALVGCTTKVGRRAVGRCGRHCGSSSGKLCQHRTLVQSAYHSRIVQATAELARPAGCLAGCPVTSCPCPLPCRTRKVVDALLQLVNRHPAGGGQFRSVFRGRAGRQGWRPSRRLPARERCQQQQPPRGPAAQPAPCYSLVLVVCRVELVTRHVVHALVLILAAALLKRMSGHMGRREGKALGEGGRGGLAAREHSSVQPHAERRVTVEWREQQTQAGTALSPLARTILGQSW